MLNLVTVKEIISNLLKIMYNDNGDVCEEIMENIMFDIGHCYDERLPYSCSKSMCDQLSCILSY